jgi:cation diffusion facilitator family transporter
MSTSSHGSSVRAIFYAFLANLGIALAKSGAAFYTGSGSMLAEAIHSFADCGNQVLLYIGLRQSGKPADAEHPLGYGKVSYFWSFIVAILLFSMGGLFSVYEGWHKLQAPEGLSSAWIALVVIGVSIIIEMFSLYGCVREINKIRGEKWFVPWFRTTRNAELVVVLAEDVAAILGLLLAFCFISAAMLTGNPVYDAAGSISIGVVLIAVALFVAVHIKALIVGRSADPEVQSAINAIISKDDAIAAVLNIITVQFGPHIMLAAKIRMYPGIPIEQAVVRLDELERKIKQEQPDIRWCFLEPDIEK